MQTDILKEGERAIIVNIDGNQPFKDYLLSYGITVGSVFNMNYSPRYTALISITVTGKMLSLRQIDFKQLEWTRI